ncbi:hypothetical protein K493DRAFT_101509 [Basidiobolus meristosporus CBS 931.73]|uniref:Ankyrin n=1 Tax=Basidiobolus meristosporus CBS 931.73 TaxID=1314790 RepID=A0A1Y1ZBH9_9FUNG|nr:hypothetical protein K493DRAFT_101509 [Basidiobolus meristosporus CBS 931.73]|eukprot:ORY07474.1 hypothetical protein K493DRAFT_101509 [Basidiobolus meristosporus CBS 931.73]
MTVFPQDVIDEVVLSARYGDLEDLQQISQQYGPSILASSSANGNTPLHMASANGHTGRNRGTFRYWWLLNSRLMTKRSSFSHQTRDCRVPSSTDSTSIDKRTKRGWEYRTSLGCPERTLGNRQGASESWC